MKDVFFDTNYITSVLFICKKATQNYVLLNLLILQERLINRV